PTASEELVRWSSPVIAFRRTLTRDVVLSGQQLAAADKVMLFYPSANRDEQALPDPYRFDLSRAPTRTSATADPARTTASARTAPGPSSGPCSRPSSPGCPTWRSPVTRTGCARRPSTASSTCRSASPPNGPTIVKRHVTFHASWRQDRC